MEKHLYIDESGSMTKKSNKYKYFVTCVIVPTDKVKLKRVFKRYISKNLEKLKILDRENKMFDKNGKFLELKGSQLTKQCKKDFLNYFTKNKLFDVYFIQLNNKEVKDRFYENTARAFNYPLRLLIQNFMIYDYPNVNKYFLNIDERNQNTKTYYFLEEYLNTEIGLPKDRDFSVIYHDSANSYLVQLADVFANIYYSNLMNGFYKEDLENMEKNEILKMIFNFPYTK
jgi:hypothetical protein